MTNRLLIALVMELILDITSSFAFNLRPFLDHHHTTVAVARDHPNRIAVVGDKIHQVFGAASLEVETDEHNGQIFVSFHKGNKNGKKKPTTLTLVTQGGLTHDVTLIPQPLGFQSLVFQVPPPESPKPEPSKGDKPIPKDHVRQATQWMTALMEGHMPASYRVIAAPQRTYDLPLKVTPHSGYQNKGNIASIYHLKNTGNKPLVLKEKALAYPQDTAVALSTSSLQPGEEGYLFVLSNLQEDA